MGVSADAAVSLGPSPLPAQEVLALVTDLWASVAVADGAGLVPVDPAPAAPPAQQADPAQQAPPAQQGRPAAGPAVARATVTMTGAWTGAAVVTCFGGAGTRWAGAMLALAEEETTPEDVRDAMAEVVNVVGGGIKARCAGGGQLGLPEVVLEPAEPSSRRDEDVVLRVALAWAGSPQDVVEVVLRADPAPAAPAPAAPAPAGPALAG